MRTSAARSTERVLTIQRDIIMYPLETPFGTVVAKNNEFQVLHVLWSTWLQHKNVAVLQRMGVPMVHSPFHNPIPFSIKPLSPPSINSSLHYQTASSTDILSLPKKPVKHFGNDSPNWMSEGWRQLKTTVTNKVTTSKSDDFTYPTRHCARSFRRPKGKARHSIPTRSEHEPATIIIGSKALITWPSR
ncbi:hypothetical protein EVAR_18935_1 [Eumeta japonica]|uniref:Uncharacterized protein n=1 Tax=Eumeta variegata TaxID=151549 RepID=A0A4C1V3F6_EUMVA|nr:hypothetical protein EVAR_18935_1 [Eumeta japonica]